MTGNMFTYKGHRVEVFEPLTEGDVTEVYVDDLALQLAFLVEETRAVESAIAAAKALIDVLSAEVADLPGESEAEAEAMVADLKKGG